jgi:starvation-inducible DNA-binding protein
MHTSIGIPKAESQKITDVLSKLLADEHVLVIKTRNYHWNINGPSFMEIHKFYESHYEILTETIDEIAERITQLGYQAKGTMKEFLALTRLEEGPYNDHQTEQMKVLLADHESICKNIRKDIDDIEDLKDPVTTDFLTGVLAKHEKMAWMIRSFLK